MIAKTAYIQGATHIGIACDIIQAAHVYTKDKTLISRMVAIQKEMLDIAEEFNRRPRALR